MFGLARNPIGKGFEIKVVDTRIIALEETNPVIIAIGFELELETMLLPPSLQEGCTLCAGGMLRQNRWLK